MISGMGLALGIDYSLFVVSRFREERRHGQREARRDRDRRVDGEPRRAVQRLRVRPRDGGDGARPRHDPPQPRDRRDPRRHGHRGRRAHAPAGGALAPRRPCQRPARAVARTARGGERGGGGPRLVARRPLGHTAPARRGRPLRRPSRPGALPIFGIQTGLTGVRELPDRFHAKRGFTMLLEEFGVGTVDSVQVVVEGDVGSVPVKRAVAELARRVDADPAFRQPDVSTSPDGRAAKVEALVVGDSRDERALTAVQRLRSDVVPEVFAGVDARVLRHGRDGRGDRLPRAHGPLAARSSSRSCSRSASCCSRSRSARSSSPRSRSASTCSRSARRTACWCSSSWTASGATSWASRRWR